MWVYLRIKKNLSGLLALMIRDMQPIQIIEQQDQLGRKSKKWKYYTAKQYQDRVSKLWKYNFSERHVPFSGR